MQVESKERPESALIRELQEELGIEVRLLGNRKTDTAALQIPDNLISCLYLYGMQVDEADLRPLTFASHPYDNFHLLMPLYGA